jgi:uncharacterized membrane protein
LTPRTRKLGLTVHVIASVGWIGAVIASAALALFALASEDPQLVRSSYITMESLAWYVLLPLSLASLFSGLVQGMGTTWGVFRHYWVVVKLCINLLSSAILLLYTQTLGSLAELARAAGGAGAAHDPSPLLHSGGALVLLTCAAALSIYKPKGRTRRGWRKQRELIDASTA